MLELTYDDGKTQAARASYPPLVLPHRGNPAAHTHEQVRSNEQYMRRHLLERQRCMKALLSEHGVHWPKELAGLAAGPLVERTREWAKTCWPSLCRPIASPDIRRHWLHGERSDDFIGLSVVADTALLLDQYIVANRPSLAWGMDTDPANKVGGMATVNRWVLRGAWMPNPEVTVVVDIEQAVLAMFIHPDDSGERLFNTWERLIQECLAGEHEGSALV